MKILRSIAELAQPRPLAAALGMFDGVHLGHQHVIRQAWLDSQQLGGISLAITFDPHPLTVVRPDRAPSLLQTLHQRLDAMSQLRIDAALIVPFDRALSEHSGEWFIRQLAVPSHHLRSLSIGEGFQFGHSRSGNVETLKTLGSELAFKVHALAPIAIGGEVVSSTRIRQAIRDGQLELAAELLGRPYALSGRVIRGNQLGRQLGFPTANIDVTGLELPPFGVYTVHVAYSQQRFPGVLNIGRRPTISNSDTIHCEVHLLDFDKSLYDETLEIELVDHLRPERRFNSPAELVAQIEADVATARRHLLP